MSVKKDHADGTVKSLSLGAYFRMRGFPLRLLPDDLAPMGAAPTPRDGGLSRARRSELSLHCR